MKVKALQNFYFLSKLYKMGTTVDIDKKYNQLLEGKIEAIDYSSNSKKELQSILDEKHIEYDTKFTKTKLIELIGGE